jgi:hypothetical protein
MPDSKIIPDIGIRNLRPLWRSTLFEENDGVSAETGANGSPRFFPLDGWRCAPYPELASAHDWVTVMDFAPWLPAQTADGLWQCLATRRQEADSDLSARMACLRGLLEEILRTEFGIVSAVTGPSDCVVNGPSQRSTAFDYAAGEFVGLHIDNHQNYPLDQRGLSDRLCCVNLGRAERYIQFVPVTAGNLMRIVSGTNPAPIQSTVDLKNRYFSLFPRQHVCRIRLLPGQAYLCNAQNLIHDGATNLSGYPDIAFLMSAGYTSCL